MLSLLVVGKAIYSGMISNKLLTELKKTGTQASIENIKMVVGRMPRIVNNARPKPELNPPGNE